MCEEKVTGIRSQTINEGSPPRVRGKDKPDEKKFTFGRITPACAGKSKHKWAVSNFRWDHPRVCGEKLRIVEVGRVKEGSPPPMRGKESRRQIGIKIGGITPACAGKSS